jgi:1,4-alpha-glucan branching enzyme
VASFLRLAPEQPGKVLACVANFAGVPHHDYRVGLPNAGHWREILNTDATTYGGSGVGNLGTVTADDHPWHGRPASALLQLPPQGVIWLVPQD